MLKCVVSWTTSVRRTGIHSGCLAGVAWTAGASASRSAIRACTALAGLVPFRYHAERRRSTCDAQHHPEEHS